MAVTNVIVTAIIAISTASNVLVVPVNSSLSPAHNSIFGLTTRSSGGDSGSGSHHQRHRGWAISSTLRGGSTASEEETPKKKKTKKKVPSTGEKKKSSSSKKKKKVIKPDETSKTATHAATPKDADLSEAILGASISKNTMKVCSNISFSNFYGLIYTHDDMMGSPPFISTFYRSR